jgi:aryl-alcohol dehydrogenase-like predicted oxidoreductase
VPSGAAITKSKENQCKKTFNRNFSAAMFPRQTIGVAGVSDTPITSLDTYRLLGRSGLRVSPLCLGTMTFGTDWGWGADNDTSKVIFEAYANRGGNFIDTANFYTNGTSEKLVGELIASERDRFVLATKYTMNMRPGDPNAGGNHRKNMVRSVEDSLGRLGTDYIDLYWLHAWDSTTPVDEVMRALDDLVRAGKILHVGASNAPAWKISQANTLSELMGWTRFVAMQVEYSLAVRDVERELLPMARELGIAVLPWSPLAGGILTGKYSLRDLRKQIAGGPQPWFGLENRALLLTEQRLKVANAVKSVAGEIGRAPAQVALNWLFTREGVVSLIPGARKLEQFEDNLAALEFTLDPALLQRLEDASAIDLGVPHDDIGSEQVRDLITGGTVVESTARKCSVVPSKRWDLHTAQTATCSIPKSSVACGA